MLFAKKRTRNCQGVTIPSQRRYVRYLERYLREYQAVGRPFPFDGRTIKLLRIRLTTLPTFDMGGGCDPYFICVGPAPNHEVLYDHKKACKNTVLGFHGKETHGDIVCKDEADGSPTGCTLYGDVNFVFYDHDKIQSDTKMMHFWINTAFIENDYLCLEKKVIDGARKDKKCEKFAANFKVELFFSSASS